MATSTKDCRWLSAVEEEEKEKKKREENKEGE